MACCAQPDDAELVAVEAFNVNLEPEGRREGFAIDPDSASITASIWDRNLGFVSDLSGFATNSACCLVACGGEVKIEELTQQVPLVTADKSTRVFSAVSHQTSNKTSAFGSMAEVT